jgi:hypothetical protein
MARAKFYDPQSVAITAFGALMQGFAQDTMIKIEQMSDAFVSEVGVDGEVARSKVSDRRVKVTLSLLQTSASNAVLSAQLILDQAAPNGAGVGSFRMEDLQGGTLVQGQQAWITKMPDNEMSRSAKAREWVIEIADAQRFEAGNTG